jgi:outer membrane protein TolC
MNSNQYFKRRSLGLCRQRPCLVFGAAFVVVALGFVPVARAQETPALEAGEAPPARLTLKTAVNQALQSSREVALARLQASVADKAAGVTRSRFLPNLFTGSGAAYSSGIPQTPGGAAPSLFNMSYIQTVFNPPLRGELHAAETRSDIQRLETDRVRENVMLSTASTYLELAKVRHALSLLHQERTSATRILELTRERVAAGLELPIELTRAELTAARVEQQNLRSEGREDVLESQLRDLCGLGPDRRVELADEQEPNFSASSDQPVPELIQLGKASSIELKQAELELRARQERLNGERGGYWPTLDFVGEYSLLAKINNYADFYKKFQRNNVNIGVQLTLPIFSSRTRAAIDLARQDLSSAQLQLRSRRSQVETDIRRDARKSRELEAAREVTRLELKLAQEDLRVLQAQFDEGRASLRDIEKLRVEETTRWLAFLDADFEFQKAHLELLRETGQLSSILQ